MVTGQEGVWVGIIMNVHTLDWWLGLFREASYIGMLGVFVSGIRVWYLTSRMEERKDSKQECTTEKKWLKRTKVIYYVCGFLVLLSTIGQSSFNAVRDDTKEKISVAKQVASERKQEKSEHKIDQLRSQNDDLVEGKNELVKGKDELVEGKNILISQNTTLNSKIEKYQTDLTAKENKIKHLEMQAKKAGRGIVIGYDYNGARRVTTPQGSTPTLGGPMCDVFNTMVQLEKDEKYTELIQLCKQQIQKTPDPEITREWLAPHMFLGSAYANSGQEEKAIKEFEYVVNNAGGDPEYDKAVDYLKQLK